MTPIETSVLQAIWWLFACAGVVVGLCYFLRSITGAVRLHLSTLLVMAFAAGLLPLNVAVRTKIDHAPAGHDPRCYYSIPFPVAAEGTVVPAEAESAESAIWSQMAGTRERMTRTIGTTGFLILMVLAVVAAVAEYIIHRRTSPQPFNPQSEIQNPQ